MKPAIRDLKRSEIRPAVATKDRRQLMRTAVFLHRHAHGARLDALCCEYDVHPGNVEGGLKFTSTWLLSCLGQICDARKCYKLDFLMMRSLELLQNLSLGATLGPLLETKGIGRKSIEKLVVAGYDTIEALETCAVDDLTTVGLQGDKATRVHSAVRRRSR